MVNSINNRRAVSNILDNKSEIDEKSYSMIDFVVDKMDIKKT